MLAAGQGITASDGKRAAPSAHALHPVQLYVLVRRAQDLDAGLYAYDPIAGRLYDTGRSVEKNALLTASLGPDACLESAAVVIIVGARRVLAIRHFADRQAAGMRSARHIERSEEQTFVLQSPMGTSRPAIWSRNKKTETCIQEHK